MDVNKILECREEKNKIILSYLSRYQVISLKANIPGTDKRIKEAYTLLSYFDQMIKKDSIDNFMIDGADGPMKIYLFNKDKILKDEMIKIEESNSLGRFVDIDVYYNDPKSISRGSLRKCYICNKEAFICGRLQKHSIEELLTFIKDNVNKQISKVLYDIIDYSILAELNIHPKFGLVTPYSNGSHLDMDYQTMINAKNSIIEYLIKMFWVGYYKDDFKMIFNEIRNIGKDAENSMFTATNGINSYKGLIFDLGLIIAASGYKIGHININYNIFDIVKNMTKGITKELESVKDTFGGLAYLKYNIAGARGEAESGFVSVQEVLKSNKLETLEDRYKALIYFICNTEDTVLLKRCGSIEFYDMIKKMFNDFKMNNETINKMSDFCIENNLSFGGSADLLIVAIFIDKISKVLSFKL